MMAAMPRSQPIIVLSQNTKRDSGRKVQLENINAAKTIADVIRTCLGPRAMLKMLMDPMGGIVMTNDGNAILREITVQHPAAKSLIEVARTQDEEVGDGTTSVVILCGEMLAAAEPFITQKMHPTVIIKGYRQALEDLVQILENEISVPIDVDNRQEVLKVIRSCLGTKFLSKWMDLACNIALDAVQTVCVRDRDRCDIDIKRYAKIEKVPGGEIEDSCVLRGVMLNKDVTHAKMRRRIEKPRILLLDCPLEYKKGESQVNMEIMKEEDFSKILAQEEEYIQRICDDVIKFKPDLVFTEKGVSDLAQHFFVKAGITAIRRVRKSDNNRLARAVGATIVNRTDEIREQDIGTGAGLFNVSKIGDEYYCFISECHDPKACTVLLRGASKDILAEVERNLHDAMHVARNVALMPRLVPGGGAAEMAACQALTARGQLVTDVHQWPYRALANSLQVVARTLAANCGANTVRTLTALRAKHAAGETTWGVNGETGQLVDMREYNVWEPLTVKLQTVKTAAETAMLLLRIDDIVSGMKKKGDQPTSGPQQPAEEAQ